MSLYISITSLYFEYSSSHTIDGIFEKASDTFSASDRNITFSFNDKVVFDKKISVPEVFKLVFDSNDKIISIENLEFDDLK